MAALWCVRLHSSRDFFLSLPKVTEMSEKLRFQRMFPVNFLRDGVVFGTLGDGDWIRNVFDDLKWNRVRLRTA